MSGLSEKVPEDPPPDESNDDVRQNLIDLASGWWVSSSVRPSESNEFENQHKESNRAVVVTQLVEWSLPTPEIRGWNPDISKMSSTNFIYNCSIEKRIIKKKRLGMTHLKKRKKAIEPRCLLY